MKTDAVLALIKAHFDHDEQRFRAMALSIAANAHAKSPRVSDTIKRLCDRQFDTSFVLLPDERELMRPQVPPTTRLSDMILDVATSNILANLIAGYRRRGELTELGLDVDRKFLFTGPPGVGKTMAAAAIAGELAMPLVRVELHGVISSYLGATAGKLAKVFQAISSRPAVYLFDEFDALAASRSTDDRGESDVGEMRRVVNTLLQMIEDDRGASIIIATTNMVDKIDHAMFRRLDDVVSFALPDHDERELLIRSRMLWPEHPEHPINWKLLTESPCAGLGHADIVAATDRAHKAAFMRDQRYITAPQIASELVRRAKIRERK